MDDPDSGTIETFLPRSLGLSRFRESRSGISSAPERRGRDMRLRVNLLVQMEWRS
jgi:hypothetical protein